MLNETHDPALESWVASANLSGQDFPVQNLPLGIFRRAASAEPFRGGVAIGDQILDLSAALAAGLFTSAAVGSAAAHAAGQAAGPALNELMAAGPEASEALRLALSRALRAGSAHQAQLEHCLLPQSQAEYSLPARIGDYTDFYASIHHATAVGRLLRPDQPLLPNYKWVPIGYHGRASSVGVSGQRFARPLGQVRAAGAEEPSLRPSARLDYELELGAFIGAGNAPGTRIDIASAERHLFGVCLLNDWSARDIQTWEYQPLGPFLAKNFLTSISPWIVTMEALAPFRTPAFRRADGDPAPLPYLSDDANEQNGGLDITLEVLIATKKMREQNIAPHRLSRGNFRDMYWTIAQFITHHTSNGCNLQPGDLLASGTISGREKESRGCLLEMTWGGKEPIELPGGEKRTFIEDGDEVIMRGYCEKEGAARIGFGECRGVVG